MFLQARKGETESVLPEGLCSLRILRTHLSAASADGLKGGSVFKARNSQGVFHLLEKNEEGKENGDCTRQTRLGPAGTDQTYISKLHISGPRK